VSYQISSVTIYFQVVAFIEMFLKTRSTRNRMIACLQVLWAHGVLSSHLFRRQVSKKIPSGRSQKNTPGFDHKNICDEH
jgi:hypothetical protein